MKFFRTNERIQAATLRVIDSEGKQLGILSRDEALAYAEKKGLDLVEIAPLANPPVAKIIDFEKFRYQEEKKEQAARRHVREVELKEIWFSPRIAQHDLEIRLGKVKKFLQQGHKVRINVKFKGREMAHPEVGHQITQEILKKLGEQVIIERETRFEGRNLTTIVGTTNKEKYHEKNQSQNQKINT